MANCAEMRQKARDKVAKLTETTTFFQEDKELLFPRFVSVELHMGRVMGRGGFCVVHEIKDIRLVKSFEQDCPVLRYDGEEKDRQFMKEKCVRKGETRYAMKKLADLAHDAPRYTKGLADLAIEVKFLSVLEHPHIIKLRGVSSEAPCTDEFFIVLDRLYDTMEMRIGKWKKLDSKSKSMVVKMFKGKKKKIIDDLALSRLVVAYDLCTALEHLHSHSIVYRDIKPENIGFDIRGDVKIFDLGLAKEILPSQSLEDGTYDLTGMTGSLRYMSPEVATFMPYNLKADVYSFGILLHQIMSMDTPFRGYNITMFKECVIEKGFRPGVPEKWPDSWKALIRSCWAGNWRKRPSMGDVAVCLRSEISLLNGGEDPISDLTNRTNKSSHGRLQADASARSMLNTVDIDNDADDRASR